MFCCPSSYTVIDTPLGGLFRHFWRLFTASYPIPPGARLQGHVVEVVLSTLPPVPRAIVPFARPFFALLQPIILSGYANFGFASGWFSVCHFIRDRGGVTDLAIKCVAAESRLRFDFGSKLDLRQIGEDCFLAGTSFQGTLVMDDIVHVGYRMV
jgi:hypothetical protein